MLQLSREPAAQPDPLQPLDTGEKQALLIKLLAESPEMTTMLKSLAKVISYGRTEMADSFLSFFLYMDADYKLKLQIGCDIIKAVIEN